MVVNAEGDINYLTLMQSLPSSTIHSYAPVVFEQIVHPRAEEAKKKGMTVEQLEEVERKLAQGSGVVFQDTGSDANNYHKAIAGNDPEINAREQNRRAEGEAKAKQEASKASEFAQQAAAANKASAEIPTTLFNMSAAKAQEAAKSADQARRWYKAAGATTLGSSAFDAAGQSFKNGGYIDFFKNGSGIHIKKKNRGKFTEFCGGKVTEECIQKGKHSSNPTTRKRATFAENARHFKHQTGGRVFMQATKVKSDDSTPITRLWDFVSNYSSEEPEKLTITSTVTPKDQDFSGYTLLGTPISKSSGKMHQDLVDLQNLFTKYNLPITITSGYREGAVTSNGSPSFHASGEAMDIVPTEGHTFQEIADIIRNTPEIANFMKSHKLGVLDETSKEMLARTGGTGAHYHVGRDKNAYKFWQV